MSKEKTSKETDNSALNIADISERFCSADEYVKYMYNQGYTFRDDFDVSKPMNIVWWLFLTDVVPPCR